MKKNQLLLGVLVLLVSGCLKTRNDVKESETKQVLQRQVVDLQKNTADTGSRFSDIEEQLRYLNGRVEAIENKSTRNDQEAGRLIKGQVESLQDVNKRLVIYQEALTKMETQLQQQNAEIVTLKTELAARRDRESARPVKESSRSSYEDGQDSFKAKDWKNAIIEYQKYRDKNPKGKHFSDATYKIGVCFQELGMKDDAKTFYQEIIASFPSSDEARKAKTRLKGLK